MVKKFDFQNNNLKLDIAGHIYEIDTTDPVLVKRVLDFANEAQALSKEMDKKEDYVQALEDTITFCLDSIDKILGEDTSKEIFTGRKVGLFDCLDVINYITSEVKADRESKFKVYSPNRAARRAK